MIVCKNCKHFRGGECRKSYERGRRILVNDDYYCRSWVGAGEFIIDVNDEMEVGLVYKVENEFGGVACIVHDGRSDDEDRSRVTLSFRFGESDYRTVGYLGIGEAEEVLKDAGFKVRFI